MTARVRAASPKVEPSLSIHYFLFYLWDSLGRVDLLITLALLLYIQSHIRNTPISVGLRKLDKLS